MEFRTDRLTRRNLLRAAGIAGLCAWKSPVLRGQTGAASDSMIGVPFNATPVVRIGLIGAGGRGTSVLHDMLGLENARILAICDVNKDAAVTAQGLVTKAGQPEPRVYASGDHDFENLVRQGDLDFIYIATPWDWHVPMGLAALKAGKHCGIEVPAATTLDDCWALVNASEQARRHCMIMENCCYGYNELLVLDMVRAGLLGDLIHGEGAYLHDLREELLSNRGEGLWRRKPHTTMNGNIYPTHGLGPVANYMGVNRGDRFDYLVSVSSFQEGLEQYRDAHFPPDDPKRKEKYVEGDMNTSVIRTVHGRTIVVQHDVVNARPYDRINLIAGTKGVFRDYPPRIYLDGQPGSEEFSTIDSYKDKYEHRLWKQEGEAARNGGHGGMDFIMLYRLVECMRKGLPPDIDVYDAAAWSSVGPLSRDSVAHGSGPVKIPDFTRGGWTAHRENLT